VYRRLSSTIVAALVSLFVLTSFVDDDEPEAFDRTTLSPWIDTSDRDAVTTAYRAMFSRPVPEMDWTGGHDGCRPGDSSDRLRSETLLRISFYRAMAGVPSEVAEDADMSRRAQAAALMMSAEGELTHHPDTDFACYSPEGRRAAANSNLYLGRTGPSAIDGYVEDPGSGNIDVGHRSTILHPPTRFMGVGHVGGVDGRYPANALWVFDDEVFSDEYRMREVDRFVAWPPRGYVPAPIVYPRWSFAIDEADFEEAEVSMTTDGRSVAVDVIARISKDGEIPSSVIVWEPDLADHDGDGEVTYRVTVSGVGLREGRSAGDSALESNPGELAHAHDHFTYEVTIITEP
jgi:hypothetical protein